MSLTLQIRPSVVGAVMAAAVCAVGGDARSAPRATTEQAPGVAAVYGAQEPGSAEQLSTCDAIANVAASDDSPMAIWQTLEHGETVECARGVPVVGALLYDRNAKTREIAAWWLRRREMGVFGPNQLYQQTLNTRASDPSATRRANAASAIGEFLHLNGVGPVATALTTDADPGVRAAAAAALGRLNSDGSGALTKALADADPTVLVAVIDAATRVSQVSDLSFSTQVVNLLGSPAAIVRTHTVQLLDQMNASSNVAAMIALAQRDTDIDDPSQRLPRPRNFGDTTAQPALQSIAQNDASGLVRDMATIALRRL